MMAVLVAAACSSSTNEVSKLPLEDGSSSGNPGDTSTPDPTSDSPAGDTYIPPGSPSRIYAHTQDTMYLFEPTTNALTMIGKFSCLDPNDSTDVVVDMAVDRTNSVYATTFTRFLKVDPITAQCTEIHKITDTDVEGNYPNALSFVPAGTVDPTKEALVGYAPYQSDTASTDYIRIDTTTGAQTYIGPLNDFSADKQYASSGDLISLIQAANKTYLTVKETYEDGGASPTDYLAEVDPTTGMIKQVIGDTGQTNIFGLGYWAGKAYGFSDNGKISAIDTSTGSAQVVYTLKGADGGAAPWYGAGVTTEAPISP